MKIVHIIPHQSPLDFKRLIGIKKMAYMLASEQIKNGHEVAFIAAKGSKSDIGKVFETIIPLHELNISLYDPRSYIYCVIHGSFAAEIIKNNQFDIVHNHAEQNFIPFIGTLGTPVVSTIHGTDFSEDIKNLYKSFFGKFHAVAISKAAQKYNSYIQFDTVVYNGIFPEVYSDNYKGDDYMFWFGRINPEKGVKESIEVAKELGRKIKIRGYAEKGKEDYSEAIKQLSDSCGMDFIEGFVDDSGKNELFSRAKIFLSPTQWAEPFGLVMVESMACGTPVVAFAKGSVTEIVKDGETGFIVNPEGENAGDFLTKKAGKEGLKEAVNKIYNLSESDYLQMRKNCRKQVEENFTAAKMAQGYEKAYKKLLGVV